MKGLFNKLTPEQQKDILEYNGPENHGNNAFSYEEQMVIIRKIRHEHAPLLTELANR